MNKINKLSGMSCYLVGPVDRAKDDGIGWRREFREKINNRNIPIEVFDPTDKPSSLGNIIYNETGVEKHKIQEYKRNGNIQEAINIIHKVRRYDLRMVDTTDFIVIYVDIDVHMCGSYDELFTAERQHKPLLAIVNPPLYENVPDWLLDVIKQKEFFISVDECLDYLENINNGIIEMDDRWVKLVL